MGRVVQDQRFDEPVKILTGKTSSVIRHVSTTAEAAQHLLYKWPIQGGRKHLAARKACMAVLEGLKAAHVARKAFAEAAQEADILVGSAKQNPVSKFLANASAR